MYTRASHHRITIRLILLFVGLLTGCGANAKNGSGSATPTVDPVMIPTDQPPPASPKPTLVVKTLDDDPSGCPDKCTLRSAISTAKSGDVIGFDDSLSGTLRLAEGLIINANLTIVGTGPDKIKIDGSQKLEIMHVSSSVNVTLIGMTFQYGGGTGGVVNEGKLRVINCVFTGSGKAGISSAVTGATLTVMNSTFTENDGMGLWLGDSIGSVTTTIVNSTVSNNKEAGIIGGGTLTVVNTTISGNRGRAGLTSASAKLIVQGSTLIGNTGAGIEMVSAGTASISKSLLSKNGGPGITKCNDSTTVTDSTISQNVGGGLVGSPGGTGVGCRLTVTNSAVIGNTAIKGSTISGSGIAYWGEVTITNTTIVGNSAIPRGGGIVISGKTTVLNSTISGNSASDGGGIAVPNGNLSLGSSIVAGNTGTHSDISGVFKSLGGNLVGDSFGLVGLFASDLKDVDPMLSSLAINAPGTTGTLALKSGSPALGKGKCDQVKTDQRGIARKSPCDIGAFERVPEDDTRPTPTGFPTITPTPMPDASSFSLDVLTGSFWRFGRADGSVIADRIRFYRSGTIGDYSNRNEDHWKMEDGGHTLVFYTADGKASTRFTDVSVDKNGLFVLKGKFLLDPGINVTHVLQQLAQ